MENKNNVASTIIIILSIIVLALSGYLVYDQVLKEKPHQPDDQQETYILTEKTNLKVLCNNENQCNKTLGMVKINNQDLELSIDEIEGKISLGDYTYIQDGGFLDNIEGFEVYDNYFIVYSNSYSNNNHINENYHSYAMTVFDDNLRKINTLIGTTCEIDSSNQFTISNGIITYQDNRRVDELGPIYDQVKNINELTSLVGTFEILFNDVIMGETTNEGTEAISVDYSCGIMDSNL